MARKSRKQTAAPMPAPSLYVHVALYIRLSVEDNKKAKCSVLIVAEAFTGNVPSAGKAPILIGSTALQTAG